MTNEELRKVHEISPGLAMLSALAEGCAKIATLEPTYSALLLAQMSACVNTPLPDLDERVFKRVKGAAYWTARGAEAVFIDTKNGQKYRVVVEPIKGEQDDL